MLSSYSRDLETQRLVFNQLQNSKELYKFLEWYLENVVKDNIFPGVYGTERAYNDGLAFQAKSLLELLSNLNTIKESSHDK